MWGSYVEAREIKKESNETRNRAEAGDIKGGRREGKGMEESWRIKLTKLCFFHPFSNFKDQYREANFLFFQIGMLVNQLFFTLTGNIFNTK